MAYTLVRYVAEEQRRLPLRPCGSGGVHRALLPWSPQVRLQVTASNFSLGLRSVCLHLDDSPRTTSAPFQAGYQPYPAGYGFPLPFGCRHSLLGSVLRLLGSSAAVAVGLPALPLDPIRVVTFRMREMRPGWVPPLLRGRGVLGTAGYVAAPLSQLNADCDGPKPPYQPSFQWQWHDGASSAVHLRSPVRSCPSPVSPDGWTFLRHSP